MQRTELFQSLSRQKRARTVSVFEVLTALAISQESLKDCYICGLFVVENADIMEVFVKDVGILRVTAFAGQPASMGYCGNTAEPQSQLKRKYYPDGFLGAS